MGKIGDARAVEPLITATGQPGDVSEIAKRALLKIGKPAIEPLIRALVNPNDYANYINPFADYKTQSQNVTRVLVMIRDENIRDIAKTAASLLGELGDARAVEPLITALRNEDKYVKREAADALGKIGDALAVEPLIAALRDLDGYVREKAADALGWIGDNRAVGPLIAALHDPQWTVRCNTTWALGKIGDNRAVEPLIAALHDPYETARNYAAEALGKIGDIRAIKPLYHAMGDTNNDVRLVAQSSLKQFSAKLNPALQHYPHLYCKSCFLRAIKTRVRIGFIRWKTLVCCRSCYNLADLITNVRVVVGFVGGDGEDFAQQGDTVHVRLWDDATGQSRNADIDRLLIRNGGVEQYDLAIDKLINTLKNDATHPLRWCKKIPVEVEAGVRLPVGAMTML